MSSRAYRRRRSFSHASFSAFFAVFLLLSTSLAAGLAFRLHKLSTPISFVPPAPKYLVLLVLDGARPDYMNVTPLPHLDALRTQGVQYTRAFAGILESETPSGHATISTGSTPAKDGLLGFNWVRGGDNDHIRLFDPNAVRQGAMEHVMQQAGAPTIASLFKSKYPKAKVVAVSGHKFYAADPLGGPNADYIMYYTPNQKNQYVPTAIPGHVPPASILDAPGLTYPTTTLPPGVEDTLAVKLAMTSFKKVRQQVTLVNLPEFDWPLGHVEGSDRAQTTVLMKDFDRDLGYIEDTYRKAGVLDKTLFVITSDHGMTPLKWKVPDSVINTAITNAGADAIEKTYSTAGYFWLTDPSRAQAVAGNMVNARDPHIQSVYYKVTSSTGDSYVRAGGLSIPPQADAANQYLLSSFQGGNAPNVVAFCTEHAAFEVLAAENWKGNHGGGAWESQHVPLIISGPGVASGTVSNSPARLEDVAPTTLSLMRVPDTGMQGSPLADAFQYPAAVQEKVQKSLNSRLVPVVEALISQSRLQSAVRR